jgi:hypothetical protein
MKKASLAALLVAGTLIAASALAQGGPGHGKGRIAWDRTYTQGWTLMTAQERAEWQTKMRSLRTFGECVAARDEHQKLMTDRAKEKGLTLRPVRRNGCEVMKARGLLK